MDMALRESEAFSAYAGLNAHDAMHMRLLTEEMLCIVRGILDDFKAEFWIESERREDGIFCTIRLKAFISVDEEQEDKLIAVSTTKYNEDAKGFVGKIRQFIRFSTQTMVQSNPDQLLSQNIWYSMGLANGTGESTAMMMWSYQKYRENIADKPERQETDDLERSIVTKIADEIRVGFRSGQTTIIVEKFFAK